MSLTVISLDGCRSDVLAHYLKALAVFRLVSQQKEPGARAFWKDGAFQLVVPFGRDELVRFFTEQYVPSPIVAPWNGGSGFYPSDNHQASTAIESSHAQRFDLLRDAISAGRAVLGKRAASPRDEEKWALIAKARASWPASLLPWLDSAVSLSDERPRYPALLGTGGNDGRLDFTNNFHQRLIELIDPDTGAPIAGAAQLLRGTLFDQPVAGLTRNLAIGQFLPGSAGGANASSDFFGPSLLNGWDFVFALEGTLAFQVAAVRRLESQGLAQAAAPFAVRSSGAGYASSALADESARGEQWMPLWNGASTWSEFERMMAEARLLSGRHPAGDAIDAATSISRAGTAKGVTAFQRFGFIERNGQANLAVPLGVWAVSNRPTAQLVERLESWVSQLRYRASQKGAPAGIGRHARQLQDAMLSVLRQPVPERVETLLVRLGAAEDAIIRSPKWAAAENLSPAPMLDEDLIASRLCDDAEVELARALAALSGPAGWTLRYHAAPLDNTGRRFESNGDALRDSPDLVWNSADLIASLCGILHRRLLATGGRFPFMEASQCVGTATLARFVAGGVDDRRTAQLTRGFMLVDWKRSNQRRPRGDLPPVFAAMKLAWSRSEEGADPRVPELLARGQGLAALRAAERRLVSLGLRLRFSTRSHRFSISPTAARRMGAALLFPLTEIDSKQVRRTLLRLPTDTTQSQEPQ